uniref:PLAT domain-containing protein n=1 Tax=Quercus lobata TaxID=97700 RepID=A0A7N2KL15_QUELO
MVLSGAEYSMAVMAAFSLSFVAILSRDPFSINADILGFSQNCSYTVLALSFRWASGMPRTKSSSAISLLGSGLGSQCKNTGLEKDTIKGYAHKTSQEEAEVKYESNFEVPIDFGPIGATFVENEHHKEMYLQDIILNGFPNGPVRVKSVILAITNTKRTEEAKRRRA